MTIQASPSGGRGAPANMSITVREDDPAGGAGVADRNIASSALFTVSALDVDRHTPPPENSTFTVVADAPRAGAILGMSRVGFCFVAGASSEGTVVLRED